MSNPADNRGHLLTEQRNPRSANLDALGIADAFDVINAEDAAIAALIAAAKPEICRTVEMAIDAFRSGGRLIYVGAGTSGRLGVLDAAECPPTFQSDANMVVGVIAGGDDALRRSIEGAEDHSEDGAAAMDALGVTDRDVVIGIATGGTTPYVHGAIERARQVGARTVFLACVDRDHVPDSADVSIRILTGPEVVTGSTRMKAGTATKLVLNTISTLAMVGIGKVYENLMVDVNTRANRKLTDRGARLVSELTGLDYDASADLLDEADGKVKTAVVMHVRQIDRASAEALLQAVNGNLREALTGEAR